MTVPPDPLRLLDWRRRVAGLYGTVRSPATPTPVAACAAFRAARDALFREHPASPLEAAARAQFGGLAYYPYDPAWRLSGTIEPDVSPETITSHLGEDGPVGFTRFARVHFSAPAGPGTLSLYWLEGYGGGMFLPFRDATSGAETFGGGRYLLDTIKGADLGDGGGGIVLDFNYAYHPSCAYDPRWVCPLAPPENRLAFAVRAGERLAAPG